MKNKVVRHETTFMRSNCIDCNRRYVEYLAEWLDQRIIWLNTYFTSDDWNGGIYLDENGKFIDPDNAVAVSTLMFWSSTGEIDVDSPGFTAEATSGGWGGQALSTGLMLFKGQKYKLSFDYTAPDTASASITAFRRTTTTTRRI